MPEKEHDPGNFGPEFPRIIKEGFDAIFDEMMENYGSSGREGDLSFSSLDDIARPLPDEITWGTPRAEYPDGNV